MKHQYFGDINDYRKYGVIRGLTDVGNVRLAVCWMLTPDAAGNVDGRKLSYLDNPKVYRHHDPQLFDLLHREVKDRGIRRVDAPALSEILPNARFGNAAIPADITARKAWLRDFSTGSRTWRIGNALHTAAPPPR